MRLPRSTMLAWRLSVRPGRLLPRTSLPVLVATPTTDSNGDPLVSVADSIESILASIVSDSPEDAPADAAAE